jgi:hypothetical protein
MSVPVCSALCDLDPRSDIKEGNAPMKTVGDGKHHGSLYLRNFQLAVLKSDILRIQANRRFEDLSYVRTACKKKKKSVAARPSPQKHVSLRTCPIQGCSI